MSDDANAPKPKTRRRKEREATRARLVQGVGSRVTENLPSVNDSSRPEDCRTVEDRVLYIARRMSKGDWMGGFAMRYDLAQIWGCKEKTVQDYASEAHRLLALDPKKREELRQELAQFCRAVMNEARATRSSVTGMPDYRAVFEGSKMVAQFTGIELESVWRPDVQQRVEIVVLPAGTEPAAAPPTEPEGDEPK